MRLCKAGGLRVADGEKWCCLELVNKASTPPCNGQGPRDSGKVDDERGATQSSDLNHIFTSRSVNWNVVSHELEA